MGHIGQTAAGQPVLLQALSLFSEPQFLFCTVENKAYIIERLCGLNGLCEKPFAVLSECLYLLLSKNNLIGIKRT